MTIFINQYNRSGFFSGVCFKIYIENKLWWVDIGDKILDVDEFSTFFFL